jgi:hypothetical protein
LFLFVVVVVVVVVVVAAIIVILEWLVVREDGGWEGTPPYQPGFYRHIIFLNKLKLNQKTPNEIACVCVININRFFFSL